MTLECPHCHTKDDTGKLFQHEGVDDNNKAWFLCTKCDKEFNVITSNDILNYLTRQEE